MVNDPYGEQLLTGDINGMMSRASNGDKLEAFALLSHLSWLVSPENVQPETGEPMPIPNSVRAYLATALLDMSRGEKGDVAFNLKRKGGSKWTHFDKRLVADIVDQLISQLPTIELACSVACERINAHVAGMTEQRAYHSAWSQFRGRPISEETAKSWYYELKDEIGMLKSRVYGDLPIEDSSQL